MKCRETHTHFFGKKYTIIWLKIYYIFQKYTIKMVYYFFEKLVWKCCQMDLKLTTNVFTNSREFCGFGVIPDLKDDHHL